MRVIGISGAVGGDTIDEGESLIATCLFRHSSGRDALVVDIRSAPRSFKLVIRSASLGRAVIVGRFRPGEVSRAFEALVTSLDAQGFEACVPSLLSHLRSAISPSGGHSGRDFSVAA